MIIFGWGHTKSKYHGHLPKYYCDHCKNEEYWELHEISKWFTLFFIPIFPYERKYLFLCPICNYGVNLEYNKFCELKPFAELNEDLLANRITREEYQARYNKLEQMMRDRNIRKLNG